MIRIQVQKTICVLGVLAILSGVLSAQDDTPPLLRLSEAVSLAEQNNVNMISARENVQKAATGVKQARTQYYPQFRIKGLASYPFQALSFTIPKGTLGTYPGIGLLPGKDALIQGSQNLSSFLWSSAAQPLTQLYQAHLAVSQARVNVNLASEQRRYTQQQLVQQVRQTYAALPAMQEQLRALAASLRWLQRQQQEAKTQFAQKTILESDLLSVEVKLEQQRYQQRVALDAFALQKEMLNRLLGRSLDQDFTVEEEPVLPEIETNPAQAHTIALTQRPEVRQADLEYASAELDVRKERANYIPQASLAVNEVSLSGNKFLPSSVGGVGLQLNWQPFDWGEKKQQLRALKITHHEAVLGQQDSRQAVLLDVDKSLKALDEAVLNVHVSRMTRDAEREKMREIQAQYDAKAGLLSSLLQEQSNFELTESQYVQALSQLWTAQANLRHSLGEDE